MDLIAISENTVKIILILGLPSLIVSMIIGLIISIFQAVTQISDASLSFVPKMIFVSAFTLDWGSYRNLYKRFMEFNTYFW
jgi:flagellar biosynthesis protein FliQ